MIVTHSERQDLPRMIELLKSSLGESLVPKSEAYFIWKHLDNPFGQSHILLAKEGEEIIGLRAFMYWKWVSGNQTIRAVRAVDTATDPAHQGKGIFRNLTLQAVDECKQDGAGLVFNSPNPISMAGYLKMGWRQVGKMPILLGPGSVFPRTYQEEFIPSLLQAYPVDQAILFLKGKAWNEEQGAPWHTPLSHDYLFWRYHTCPVVQYGAVAEPGQFGFVFRLKRLNRFYELRICEAWTEKHDIQTARKARLALQKVIRSIRPMMVSYAPTVDYMQGKTRPSVLFGPLKKGPMVTIRPLALENLDTFDGFSHWQPSMGSMELF